jgi:protocatechuate 3,4-dioxygenase beta subunit
MDVFSLSTNPWLFIVNVAFCSITLGAMALSASYVLQRCSLPLRYALLCFGVVSIVACPLPIWFGCRHGLGLVTLQMNSNDQSLHSQFEDLGSKINPTRDLAARSKTEADQGDLVLESTHSQDILLRADDAKILPVGPTQTNSVSTHKNLGSFGMSWLNRTVGCLSLVWLAGSFWYLKKLVGGFRLLYRLQREVEITNDRRLSVCIDAIFLEMRGKKCRTRIYESTLAQAPLTVGWWQPAFVVPKDLAKRLDDEQLESVLTHEVAHLVRRDSYMALLQQLSLVLFWWNPFLRFVNQQISQLRERICDDHAVKRLGNGVPLATAMVTIAEWSVGRDKTLPFVATLIDFEGEIEGRINRLADRERKIVVSLNIPSKLMLGLAGILIGTASLIPVVRAQIEIPSASKDVSSPSEWQVLVRTVDAQGNPIANSKIGFQFRGNEAPVLETSNDDGWFVKSFKTQTPAYLIIHARADGYAPMRAFWRNGDEYPLDPLPAEFTFKMMKAITVGGAVIDEAGEPIEGARVQFSAGVKQDSDASRAQISFSFESYTTDEKGRWSCDLAPQAIDTGSINVYHPDYVFDSANYNVDDKIPLLREATHQWILKKGFAISGRVVDSNDNPIEGATLALGELNRSSDKGPFPRTDSDGRYRFEAVSPRSENRDGPISFTIMVLKHGFQPVMESVPGYGKRPMNDSSPQERIVNFQLTRGVPVTIRVVDTLGQPVESVNVDLRYWHDTETLGVLQKSCLPTKTDAQGIWQWNDFPRGEAIRFDFYKQGFADVRQLQIKVNDPSVIVTVVLNRPQVIVGTVVDAITKKPIPEFVIQRAFEGMKELRWIEPTRSKNGVYRKQIRMPSATGSYTYRAMAEGYTSAISQSTPYEEGKTTVINFELVPLAPHATQTDAEEEKKKEAPAKSSKSRRDKFETEVKTTPVSIYGRTIRKDGKPIPGVRVWAVSSRASQTRLGEAVSDENGNYRIENVIMPFEVRPYAIEHSEFELFGMAEGFAFAWHRTDYYPMLVRKNLPTGHSYESSTGESYVWDESRKRYRAVLSENEYAANIFSINGIYGDKQIKVDLAFSAPSRFSSQLVDDQGRPIVDASIGLWHVQELRSNVIERTQTMYVDGVAPSELRNRRTDQNGFFEYANLPQNCSLRLSIAPKGFTRRDVQGFTGNRAGNIFDEPSDIDDGSVITFKRPIKVPIQVVYDDTGLPAKNVSVGLGNGETWDLRTTDKDGRATLTVPAGKHSLGATAEYGTPYLSAEADPSSESNSHVISADSPTATMRTIRLKRAAEVDVQVVDSTTGKGIAGYDFWIMKDNGTSEYLWRSFEPPNLFRVDRPLTDENGRAKLLFVPGKHTIGVEANPSQSIECVAGQVTSVTFMISKK